MNGAIFVDSKVQSLSDFLAGGLNRHLSENLFPKLFNVDKSVQKLWLVGQRGATTYNLKIDRNILTGLDFLLLVIGTNNMANGQDADSAAESCFDLAQFLHLDLSIKHVVICGVIPRRGKLVVDSELSFLEKVKRFNSLIKQRTLGQPHLTFLRMEGFFLPKIEDFSKDDIHPNKPFGRELSIANYRRGILIAANKSKM